MPRSRASASARRPSIFSCGTVFTTLPKVCSARDRASRRSPRTRWARRKLG
jgi:hypothetical protein